MDKSYADTVRLLLRITPDVFTNDIFAMKGGTAINLFVRDMPRLSVDIDVAYTPWQHPREQALPAITAELNAIAGRVAKLGLTARAVPSKDLGDTKLLIEDESQPSQGRGQRGFPRHRAADRAPSPDGPDCRDVQR